MFETKITKLLDSEGIPFRLLSHSRQVFTCEEAAKERNVPLSEMIKCILLVDKQKNYSLACLPADKALDTNKVRELVNCSRLSFATDSEMLETLGYEKGAIPPLLLKNKIPVIFDSEVAGKQNVNISSGNPAAGLELKASDLIALAKPVIGSIAK